MPLQISVATSCQLSCSNYFIPSICFPQRSLLILLALAKSIKSSNSILKSTKQSSEDMEDLEDLLLRIGGSQASEALLRLPVDIFLNIISRLPIKPLAVCRCVCKTWREILHHPRFTTMHSIRAITQPPHSTSSPLFHVRYRGEHLGILTRGSDIYLLEHDDEDVSDVFENGVVVVNPRLEVDVNFVLVGSCNGLVCLADDCRYEPIFICNPVIGECIRLPRIWELKNCECQNVSGFGFDPVNNEYKVIRMQYGYVEDDNGDDEEEGEGPVDYNLVAAVYTLGSGQWRELGDVPYLLRQNDTQVFVNGALHWQKEEDIIGGTRSEFIVAFDVGREEFGVIPHPTVQDRSCVGDLGGNLCLLDHTYVDRCEVWVMKEYGVNSSWTKEYVISRNVPGFNRVYFSPLMLMKNGKILLLQDYEHLICYDPARENFSRPWIPKLPPLNGAVPHVESFISPRDIVRATNSSCSVNTGRWYRTMQLISVQHAEQDIADGILNLQLN